MLKDPTIKIQETFLENDIDCSAFDGEYCSEVVVSYPIQQGPEVSIRFRSITDNSVSVKVFGLMHRVPGPRINQLLHALNMANTLMSHLSYFYDEESLDASYKVMTVDDDIGEICVNLLIDIEVELDLGYSIISKVLHDPPIKRQRELTEILRILQAFRDHPIPFADTEEQ